MRTLWLRLRRFAEKLRGRPDNVGYRLTPLRILLEILGTLLGTGIALVPADDYFNSTKKPEFLVLFFIVFGGAVLGYLFTPFLTWLPYRALQRASQRMTAERVVNTVLSQVIWLLIAALLSLPILLDWPEWRWLVVLIYAACFVSGTLFGYTRADFVAAMRGDWKQASFSPEFIVDTSALIDARILDVVRSGFLLAELLIPKFVIEEELQVSLGGSKDAARRAKGTLGMEVATALTTDPELHSRVIESVYDGILSKPVDSRIIELARERHAGIITTDFNLNQAARTQGVKTLNVNTLTNAVKPIYPVGTRFTVMVNERGNKPGQGAANLPDGTKVYIANGLHYLNTGFPIEVVVRSITQKDQGRLIWADVVENVANGNTGEHHIFDPDDERP